MYTSQSANWSSMSQLKLRIASHYSLWWREKGGGSFDHGISSQLRPHLIQTMEAAVNQSCVLYFPLLLSFTTKWRAVVFIMTNDNNKKEKHFVWSIE